MTVPTLAHGRVNFRAIRSGHTEVSVWVLDTNQRGRAFYERMGLTLDGAAKTDTLDGFPLTEVRYRAALG